MAARHPPSCTVRQLGWSDPKYGEIATPRRPMRLAGGYGSGLSLRHGGGEGIVWAVCDRGPNLKIKTALERFGLSQFENFEGGEGAKVMPRLDLRPVIAELRLREERVELVRTIRIADAQGQPVSGLPIPASGHAQCEPALDMEANVLEPDPNGMDSEGLAALRDGGFWVSDEYGPSLLRIDAEGRVQLRLLPKGLELRGAGYACRASLPALAVKRQLNRGFEAISLSQDEKWLFVAFQSPLAHPDKDAHEKARHVRIWRLDAASGDVAAQYLYPLDAPQTFLRDTAKGEVEKSDLKVSEVTALSDTCLLVLERGSETTKIYRVELDAGTQLPPEHLEEATRPTVEELSAEDSFPLPELEKSLIFNTDDHPEIAADLEGMAVLSPSRLLLVNDNDFGTEGAETSFWRIDFEEPMLR